MANRPIEFSFSPDGQRGDRFDRGNYAYPGPEAHDFLEDDERTQELIDNEIYGNYDFDVYRPHEDWTSFAQTRRSPPTSPPSYVGLGPKNYQRSDESIRDQIHVLMTEHPRLDASEIQIEVRDGEVTLNGTVSSRRAKKLAEMIADCVRGVKDVHNKLIPDHPGADASAYAGK